MFRKKEVYTTITPIPGYIPRQLAIDILHSHSEVITLNPLVLDHKPIPAPRYAAADEFYATWYEIIERIQYVPGMGRMGSGKINFNGCFHDTTWGLQTHIYAPMNVDLRNAYRIGGNQPGVEPPEPMEIGAAALGVPSDGLYLREDIEIRCNIAVVGFVKSQLKAASKEMVRRMIKKAELLDTGVLKAMIYEGRLKTINPNDLSAAPVRMPNPTSPPGTPYQPQLSPRMYQASAYHAVHPPSSPRRSSWQEVGPAEMPGDFYHPPASPTFQHRVQRDSGGSIPSRHSASADPRACYRSGPPTPQSDHNPVTPPPVGVGSPVMAQKGLAVELEAGGGAGRYPYNPRDSPNVHA